MKILIATLFAAASLTSTSAFAAEELRVLGHGYTTSLANATTTFHVRFNIAPDFYTTDQFGRAEHALQFWTDSEEPNPIARTYATLDGSIPAGTTTVISWNDVPETGKLEVIWPKATGSPGPWSSTGWGETAAMTEFSVSADNTVSFTVPLALLHDDDGMFYFSFETYSYGGFIQTFHSVANAVPEPSIYIMLLGGLGFVGFLARGRKAL